MRLCKKVTLKSVAALTEAEQRLREEPRKWQRCQLMALDIVEPLKNPEPFAPRLLEEINILMLSLFGCLLCVAQSIPN